MWSDGSGVPLRTCPVLAYTPAIELARELARYCYEPRSVGMSGTVMLELVRLPEVGAIGDQDAWNMDAMAYLARCTNGLGTGTGTGSE